MSVMVLDGKFHKTCEKVSYLVTFPKFKIIILVIFRKASPFSRVQNNVQLTCNLQNGPAVRNKFSFILFIFLSKPLIDTLAFYPALPNDTEVITNKSLEPCYKVYIICWIFSIRHGKR